MPLAERLRDQDLGGVAALCEGASLGCRNHCTRTGHIISFINQEMKRLSDLSVSVSTCA